MTTAAWHAAGMAAPLHPDLEPLAVLIGTWSGPGRGEYPTIEPFDYEETVTFSHVGKPFLAYSQRTLSGGDARPLHSEVGFWRLPRPGLVEVVLSHPTGIAEVTEGRLEGRQLSLRSTSVSRTGTALEVLAIERHFEFDDSVLRYSLAMAAMGQPMTHHLAAELHRVD